MFGLFKKKKKSIPEMPISEAIVECKKQGAKSVSINLYIEDQILFQVMLAKHFKAKGLESDNSDDMAIIHFFNKNKTLTLETWERFKSGKMENDFLHYEDPKGIFNYVKNIGDNPKNIEQAIQKDMTLYELTNESIISIEYTGQ